ncbi:MAG: hypothetical protein EP322_00140 [Bacteroidetes bacterium]|nr:MAG: hypothetical protein EP322_00140 [Bacteroidota bacterium]
MKWILFWVFLVLFVLMVVGTLAMVFYGFGQPTPEERSLMVTGLIIEVAACVVALFYSIFGLKKGGESNQDVTELIRKIEVMQERLDGIELEKSTRAHKGGSGEVSVPRVDEGGSADSRYVSDFEKMINDFKVKPKFAVDKYPLNPTVDEIKESIRSTRPFDKKHREKSYIGMNVQWKALFSDMNENDDSYRITADVSDTITALRFDIDKKEGQAFRHLDRNTPFWVCGTISSLDMLAVDLENVSIYFGG